MPGAAPVRRGVVLSVVRSQRTAREEALILAVIGRFEFERAWHNGTAVSLQARSSWGNRVRVATQEVMAERGIALQVTRCSERMQRKTLKTLLEEQESGRLQGHERTDEHASGPGDAERDNAGRSDLERRKRRPA